MPSLTNPDYSVYILSGSTKYNVTSALVAVDRSEAKKEMAQSVNLQLVNAEVNGSRLSDIIRARDRVYVYADDGTTKDEVFRGFVWTGAPQDSLSDMSLSLKCYDHLIYLQESEDSEFFSSGMATEDVVKKVCSKWGVKLQYDYYSITHSAMALRGYLSDILTSDVLDLVKDRRGKAYTITSVKDVMQVKPVGSNKTIYHILEGKNVTSACYEYTMNGMITKVVILGTAGDDAAEPVEGTRSKNTDKYGTLQKIIRRSSETTLAEAKEEATNLLTENCTPATSYMVKAPDIPWIRKGDKVFVNAGSIKKKYLIVDDIDRTVDNTKKEMSLTLSEA